jgi:sugar lactone lactonase YvrE
MSPLPLRILLVVLATAVVNLGWPASHAEAQSIFTVAGGGSDEGRPATLAGLTPAAVAVDSDGVLHVSDKSGYRVVKVDDTTGRISTIAGNGSLGTTGDGGPSTEASILAPWGVAVGAGGDLYIGNYGLVRKVDGATGIITTVAGDPNRQGFSGDGGPATLAGMTEIMDIAVDARGDIYLVDVWNHRIRKISTATGIISTVAGTGEQSFSGDGGPATVAALNQPMGIDVDPAGNLFIADGLNNRIRKVDAVSGIISTVAGNGNLGFAGDGGAATQAELAAPSDVLVDELGTLFVADRRNRRIRVIDHETKTITTIAGTGESLDPFDPTRTGDGGPATQAVLQCPGNLAMDGSGSLYVAGGTSFESYVGECDRRVRRIDMATRTITTVAGNGTAGYVGEGRLATDAALILPQDVVADSAGNIYISQDTALRVSRVDAQTRIITTVAGTGHHAISPDGGPATETPLHIPWALAVDGVGNLYVGDGYRVRMVEATSEAIMTVAGTGEKGFSGDGDQATQASIGFCVGIEVDRHGNLFIADRDNNRVRRVDATTGVINTVAGNGQRGTSGDGGPATEANVGEPTDVVVDDLGNLYVSDDMGIRKVDSATGLITTVASAADQPRLSGPIALDDSRNLYAASDWGQVFMLSLKDGLLTAVAGDRDAGWRQSGDNGAAVSSNLFSVVTGLALDASGNLYIASGNRVRAVFSCVDAGSALLSSPDDGSTGAAPNSQLAWMGVDGVFRYDVYLDTTSQPQRLVATNVETTSLSVSGLEPLTTYYWKVVAKGDPFCDPFRTAESEVWSFTTTSSCDVPGGLAGKR